MLLRVCVTCFALCASYASAAERKDALVSPAVAKAKAAILHGQVAPEITEFKNVSTKITKLPTGKLVSVVCGLVNTYSNGGFVGLQSFVYVVDPVRLIVVSPDTTADDKAMATLLCN